MQKVVWRAGRAQTVFTRTCLFSAGVDRVGGRGTEGPSQDAEASGRDGVGASSLSPASDAASDEL